MCRCREEERRMWVDGERHIGEKERDRERDREIDRYREIEKEMEIER